LASDFYRLVLGILIVWRITHLLYDEDGPFNLSLRIRGLAGEGFWGSALDCFYCLSLWSALPLAYLLGEGWKEQVLLWPALSGGAIVVERLTLKCELQLPISYTEDKEN
jgi:hypothetical protein